MHRTNIYLEDRQREALDRLASAEGVTRAEVIRRLLDRALEGGDDAASDLAAIEASFGVLDDISPVRRGDEERRGHLDDVWRNA